MKRNIGSSRTPLLLLLAAFLLLAAAPQTVLAQDEPVLAKDSIEVRVSTHNTHPVHATNPQWRPQVSFILLGEIHSASVYWVEVGLPTKKKWLHLPCQTVGSNQYDHGPEKEMICTRRWDPNKINLADFTVFVGMVDFSIMVRNELQGTNATLFSGKAKVAKQPTPSEVVKTTWYVDEDWRLPIAYLYLRRNELDAAMTFRGSVGGTTYYLFSQGKQLSECKWERGRDPKLSQVRAEKCRFTMPAKAEPSVTDVKYTVNAGQYEIKVLADGELARSVKFTINADGALDKSISEANQLGSDRVIVPVTVIGTADGAWNKLAWKTDAFYGNPLAGFTAPP